MFFEIKEKYNVSYVKILTFYQLTRNLVFI